MAFHFRKLKNTLRLLPSTKTMGFSTRLNEGDGLTLSAYPEDYSVASQQGFNDLISRSMKHAVSSDLCTADSECKEGTSMSQSNLELSSHFLPALISKSGSVLPLPVTCNDLAQVLRLPVPLSADKDLNADVGSVLRIVYPTSDDILVEITQGLSDFIPSNTPLKDFFKYSLSPLRSDNTVEGTSPNLSQVYGGVGTAWSPQMPVTTPLTDFSLVAESESDHVQTFSSNSDPTNHHPSCNLFSSSSPNNVESPSPNSRSQQGKTSGKDGPSPEQMQKVKEKLEKAVCKLFSGRQDYSILHKNIVLENNLFGDNKTSVGMLAYGIEILKLRLRVHARFSNTSMELQSVTMLEQNGVIRIHWRLRGLSQIQTLKFWRIFQSKSAISKDDYEWLEAFSYFHIGKDGLVHKHRIDRMIPDDTSGTDKITNTLRELLTPAKPLVS